MSSRLVHTGLSLAIALFAAVLVTWAPRLGAQTPQNGEEKSIFVTVLDQANGPLKNLTAADFVVKEDNATRKVTSAVPATEPLFISLLVDTTQPPPGVNPQVQDLRKALSTFVSTVQTASPDAQIALTFFGGASVKTVDFTTKTADLDTPIEHLFPSQRQGGVLLEALVDASKDLSTKPSPRRVIVALIFNSVETSAIQPRNVSEEIQKAGASLWALSVTRAADSSSFQAGAAGVAMDNVLAPTREVILTGVPKTSGGLRLTAIGTASLEALLTTVANDLTSQYEVTYIRPEGASVKHIKPDAKGGVTVLMSPWVR
jgi:hypothetical protein